MLTIPFMLAFGKIFFPDKSVFTSQAERDSVSSPQASSRTTGLENSQAAAQVSLDCFEVVSLLSLVATGAHVILLNPELHAPPPREGGVIGLLDLACNWAASPGGSLGKSLLCGDPDRNYLKTVLQ